MTRSATRYWPAQTRCLYNPIGSRRMYLLEVARLSLHTLAANKLRAALTMLGISIGVGAVIALLAIGTGVQAYITQQFSSAGTNLIAVVPGQIRRGPGGGAFGPQTPLGMSDYRAVVA